MKLKDYAALAATSVFALTSFSSAFAHEVRILPTSHGNIQLVVGFHVEPAFEDSFNAVDVILSTTDGVCPGSGSNLGQPIDVNGTAGAQNPDTVNLKVEALYLQKSVPPGGAPIGNIAPAGIITKLRITDSSPLNEAFGRPGVYNSYFRPTNPGDGTNGAYGFHIFGNVHAGPNSVTCPGSSTPHLLAARSLKITILSAVSRAASFRRTPSAASRRSSPSPAMPQTDTTQARHSCRATEWQLLPSWLRSAQAEAAGRSGQEFWFLPGPTQRKSHPYCTAGFSNFKTKRSLSPIAA